MSEKRPKIYAIDFDGTICENKWPGIGEPIQDTVNYILDIQERGDQWILYTMREGEKLDEAMSWLALRGLHPDEVNDNLPQMKEFYHNNPRKIFANVYIDDHNAGGLFLQPSPTDDDQAYVESGYAKRMEKLNMGHKHNPADASLIAAAPELYTILETIVISGKLPLGLYANAKKVLQKARGEQ